MYGSRVMTVDGRGAYPYDYGYNLHLSKSSKKQEVQRGENRYQLGGKLTDSESLRPPNIGMTRSFDAGIKPVDEDSFSIEFPDAILKSKHSKGSK